MRDITELCGSSCGSASAERALGRGESSGALCTCTVHAAITPICCYIMSLADLEIVSDAGFRGSSVEGREPEDLRAIVKATQSNRDLIWSIYSYTLLLPKKETFFLRFQIKSTKFK